MGKFYIPRRAIDAFQRIAEAISPDGTIIDGIGDRFTDSAETIVLAYVSADEIPSTGDKLLDAIDKIAEIAEAGGFSGTAVPTVKKVNVSIDKSGNVTFVAEGALLKNSDTFTWNFTVDDDEIEEETEGPVLTFDSENSAKFNASYNATLVITIDETQSNTFTLKALPRHFSVQFATVTDSVAGHSDRQDNTDEIDSVKLEDGVITITLKKTVAELKDFDGGNGWGVHKWLGIGINTGLAPLTVVKYNGTLLTEADIEAAGLCGLSSTSFVRWVAADLVLAGDNSEKSKDTFTLGAEGYKTMTYTLKIVEPEGT